MIVNQAANIGISDELATQLFAKLLISKNNSEPFLIPTVYYVKFIETFVYESKKHDIVDIQRNEFG